MPLKCRLQSGSSPIFGTSWFPDLQIETEYCIQFSMPIVWFNNKSKALLLSITTPWTQIHDRCIRPPTRAARSHQMAIKTWQSLKSSSPNMQLQRQTLKRHTSSLKSLLANNDSCRKLELEGKDCWIIERYLKCKNEVHSKSDSVSSISRHCEHWRSPDNYLEITLLMNDKFC